MKVFGKFRTATVLGLSLVFTAAFLRVHMRVQTTLIGYELGRMKNAEGELLEKRSVLQMELARLTTKSHLTLMVDANDTIGTTSSVATR